MQQSKMKKHNTVVNNRSWAGECVGALRWRDDEQFASTKDNYANQDAGVEMRFSTNKPGLLYRTARHLLCRDREEMGAVPGQLWRENVVLHKIFCCYSFRNCSYLWLCSCENDNIPLWIVDYHDWHDALMCCLLTKPQSSTTTNSSAQCALYFLE